MKKKDLVFLCILFVSSLFAGKKDKPLDQEGSTDSTDMIINFAIDRFCNKTSDNNNYLSFDQADYLQEGLKKLKTTDPERLKKIVDLMNRLKEREAKRDRYKKSKDKLIN